MTAKIGPRTFSYDGSLIDLLAAALAMGAAEGAVLITGQGRYRLIRRARVLILALD